MTNFNDFDLDVVAVATEENGIQARITSISLCTPGCVTGILMGCNAQTATCNCSINISKK